MSAKTVKSGILVEDVAAHELGHVLNLYDARSEGSSELSVESKATFERIRDCLTKQRKKEPDPFYIGEDFADLIAAKVSISKSNPFCSYFPSQIFTEGSNTFLNSPNLAPSLQNFDPDDDHSSIFFRLLHHQWIKKGEHSQACQKLIKLDGSSVVFRDCFEQ